MEVGSEAMLEHKPGSSRLVGESAIRALGDGMAAVRGAGKVSSPSLIASTHDEPGASLLTHTGKSGLNGSLLIWMFEDLFLFI